MDFTGKVAVVTGGASGMGAATAREFRVAGAEVVIVDRNAELAAQLVDELGCASAIGDVSASGFCNFAVENLRRPV